MRVEWKKDPATGQMKMQEVPGTEFELPADLVLLAMGFVSPVHKGMLDELGVDYDARGNVKAATDGAGCYQTSRPEGLRRRRHAARAVAGGVGDPRRPPVRARGRRVPDGLVRAAALTR